MLPRHAAAGLALAALLLPVATAPAEGPGALLDVRFLVAGGADADLDRADAATPALLDAFERATGGRARLALAGPAAAIGAPGGPLFGAATSLAHDAFAAGLGADVIVVLAGDGVDLTDPSCACVAWSQRARNPSPLGAPYDATPAFGAPDSFVGVVGLAGVRELADAGELEYRFLHEIGHMWCCRVPPEAATPGLLAARGAHWAADLDLRLPAGVRDPLAGDGSEQARGGVDWRYSALTLSTMGLE